MKLKLAQFSTIILFALVMGVFWGTWFALSRSIVAFRPQTFLDIGQTAIRNLAVPMRILMPLALVSALILLALLPKRSAAFALAVAGFMLMVYALVVTLAVEVPIDNQIKVWTIGTLLADWQAIRDRWEFYYALRTFGSIVALISVTASTLSNRPAS
jgi:anthrone oxygenase-like protein